MAQGSLDIAEFITKTGGELAGRVLLVDDLVDSGVTLTRVIALLKQRFSTIVEVRTAVLWYKAVSHFKPDYHVQYLPRVRGSISRSRNMTRCGRNNSTRVCAAHNPLSNLT